MVFIKTGYTKGIKYASLVQSVLVNGKSKHKVLKYLGRYDKLMEKLMKGELILDLKDITLDKALDYGDVVALKKISERLKLKQIINKYVDKKEGISYGDIIEIWAINRATEPKSTNQMQDWYKRTVLPYINSIPADKIYPELLCTSLDKFDNEVIFNIHKDLNKVLEKEFGIDMKTIIYDITSTYFEGEKCVLAEFGYSRDKRDDKKQIIIGIVVSFDKGIPIYHFVDKGNISDITTKLGVDNKLKQFGVENVMMIHDRGMTSKDNIRISDRLKYDYITALDSGIKHSDYWIDKLKNFWSDYFIVDEHKKKIMQDGNMKEIIYRTKTKEMIAKEHDRKKKYVLIYDEELAELKKTSRENSLAKAKRQLGDIKNKIEKKSFNKKYTIISQIKEAISGYTKYFKIETKEEKDKVIDFKWEFKEDIQKEEEEKDGYYILICTDSSKTQLEIYSAFRYKCEVEAVIKDLKQIIKLHPIRHWKNMRPEGIVFVCIMGYLLRRVMNIILNQNKVYDSVSTVLDMLNEVKEVEVNINKKNIKKLTAHSTEVKNLMKILDITSEI
jgi:transposase